MIASRRAGTEQRREVRTTAHFLTQYQQSGITSYSELSLGNIRCHRRRSVTTFGSDQRRAARNVRLRHFARPPRRWQGEYDRSRQYGSARAENMTGGAKSTGAGKLRVHRVPAGEARNKLISTAALMQIFLLV
jgi:hypothetical protein